MAADAGVLALMRGDLDGVAGIRELKMFGGICFMWQGNMLCGAHKGGAMYRVGKQHRAEALALDGVAPMTNGGRPMGGFVDASCDAVADDVLRARLLTLAQQFVGGLPAT